MQSMTKTTLVAALLAALTNAASAQQRTFYDSRGNVVGRSSTDSQGTTTTNYDSKGNVISRESTSGNTTTVYDARGRNVGRGTTSR
jgi:YD repeat-containing protein